MRTHPHPHAHKRSPSPRPTPAASPRALRGPARPGPPLPPAPELVVMSGTVGSVMRDSKGSPWVKCAKRQRCAAEKSNKMSRERESVRNFHKPTKQFSNLKKTAARARRHLLLFISSFGDLVTGDPFAPLHVQFFFSPLLTLLTCRLACRRAVKKCSSG